MTLSISQIIDNIMAQSAIAAIIDEAKSDSLLSDDHRSVLRAIIRQEFCNLSLSLMPLLADISIPDDSSDLLEYIFNDPGLNENSAVGTQIQYILSCAAIAAAYGISYPDVAGRFRAMASALTESLTSRLLDLDLPRAITSWRI